MGGDALEVRQVALSAPDDQRQRFVLRCDIKRPIDVAEEGAVLLGSARGVRGKAA